MVGVMSEAVGTETRWVVPVQRTVWVDTPDPRTAHHLVEVLRDTEICTVPSVRLDRIITGIVDGYLDDACEATEHVA
jgi:hypothetical protein